MWTSTGTSSYIYTNAITQHVTLWVQCNLCVFQDDSGDFEKLPWFTAVETFCHGHGHEELEHTDRQTLSNIIEKTVLPKITGNTLIHTCEVKNVTLLVWQGLKKEFY